MGDSDFPTHSLSRRMVVPLMSLWVSLPAYVTILFALLAKWVSRFLGTRDDHPHTSEEEEEKKNLNFAAKKSITEPYYDYDYFFPPTSSLLLDGEDHGGRTEESSVFSTIYSTIDDGIGKPIIEKDEQPQPTPWTTSSSFLRFRFQTYDEFIDKKNRGNDAELNLKKGLEEETTTESAVDHHQITGTTELEVAPGEQSHLSSRDDENTDGSDEDDDGRFYYKFESSGRLSSPPIITTGQDDDHYDGDESVSEEDEQEHKPEGDKEEGGKPNDGPATQSYKADSNGPVMNLNPEDELTRTEKPPKEEEKKNFSSPKFLNPEKDDDFAVSSEESDSEDDNSMVSSSAARSSNFSIRSSLIDSASDGLLQDIDFTLQFDLSGSYADGVIKSKSSNKLLDTSSIHDGFETDDRFETEDAAILEELKRIEEETAAEEEAAAAALRDQKKKNRDRSKNTEQEECDNNNNNNSAVVVDEPDHPNEMEKEWEHQELIEQLKMEMKKVRATGLPTIFEESESLRISEDLKPWKIDDHQVKYVRVGGGASGTMDEIHKFYKSYRERMRKLDIFNYQKMYAIGFLRLKDPHNNPMPNHVDTSTFISREHCWPFHHSKPSSDSKYPMLKLRRDLESDLETVYVGQLCLSWEFLHWQYEKALSLWDTDPRSTRTYNEVAGEFQQFQVLIQRYLEDAPFQGPRVLSFVRSRCINRHILQVPLIREDSAKQRKAETGKGSITSLMLVEMVEESIRVLWRFIRTDKDTKTKGLLLGCSRKTAHVELQNAEDAEFLMEVETNLRKKYKKLRDAMRSECCILKKLQRHLGDELQVGVDEVSCFFSQVDLKLVSRVLTMSRITTEQLAWCSAKLDTVNIVNNRIRIDPSFLLFPC